MVFVISYASHWIAELNHPRRIQWYRKDKELKQQIKTCKKFLVGKIPEGEAAKLHIRTNTWSSKGVLKEECNYLVNVEDPLDRDWNWNF